MFVSTRKSAPLSLSNATLLHWLRISLSLGSLFQFFLLARLTQPWLIGGSFEWAWRLRLPALIVGIVLVAYLGRDGLRGLQRPRHLPLVLCLSVGTLISTYVAVFILQVWIPRLPTAIDMVLFLVTGLLAEEFWFRGTLFTLWQRQRSTKIVILITAVLYGSSHWQYHGFAFTLAAGVQIIYTMLLGIIFGTLRAQTRSLWPSVGLHLVINLIAVGAIWR